jgi:transcriptional regulator with XRE-family HTH domain
MLLRTARLQKGWTQTQLAARLGIQQPSVAQWEAGSSCPRPSMRPAINKLLGQQIEFGDERPLTIHETQELFRAIEIAVHRIGTQALELFSTQNCEELRKLTRLCLKDTSDVDDNKLLPPDITQ